MTEPLPISASTSIDRAAAIVAAWVEQTVPSEWRAAARRGGIEALRAVRPRSEYEAWYPSFAASGLVAATWPEPYGGLGVSMPVARAIEAVLAPFHLGRLNPLGLDLAGPTLLAHGTEAQRRRYLRPIVRNEERWCQLFSEPGAGSDLASLAARAVRDGDEWVITGQKVWSTWADESQLAMTLARTDPSARKREGITYFVVALDAPGVTVRPLRQMTGDADFFEVFLDDVRVPDGDVVGEVGAGWKVVATTLGSERQMISGAGSGGIDRLGGRSVERLLERLRTDGAWADARVRQRVTSLYATGRALAWTNARARGARRAGRSPGTESSIGKLLNAEHNQALQEAWVDLGGPGAVASDPDDGDAASIAHGFLRSRANTIEGGTSEVQRNILGERILGLPREPDPYRDLPWSEVPR